MDFRKKGITNIYYKCYSKVVLSQKYTYIKSISLIIKFKELIYVYIISLLKVCVHSYLESYLSVMNILLFFMSQNSILYLVVEIYFRNHSCCVTFKYPDSIAYAICLNASDILPFLSYLSIPSFSLRLKPFIFSFNSIFIIILIIRVLRLQIYGIFL